MSRKPIPIPPTRFGTSSFQPKTAARPLPFHAPPPTRFGNGQRPLQAMWSKEQNEMSERRKKLFTLVSTNKTMDKEKQKELLDSLGEMSAKIVENINVNDDLQEIQDFLFPPEKPLPKGAVKIAGKPAFLIGEINKTKIYGYLDESIFNGDTNMYQFYLQNMLNGLIASKSTGDAGVKKETYGWVIKATIKQAKANQGVDNLESPCGDISKVGDVMLISFTKMVKRH